jgi:ribosomal protein S18 acetylase RimI-like enzyme
LEVSVRKFRSGDANFLLELSRAAFAEFSHDQGRSTLTLAEHWTCLIAEVVERAAVNAGAVATEPALEIRRAVGFVVLKLSGMQLAEVLAIAVVEHERGRGYGRALLRASEQLARKAGASGLLLHTADANLAAFELFMKSGFRVKRRLPRYYVNVYDACELQKDW